MTISALDNDTVKLLTTTQIITSVSGAVKELIENALDADAKNIEINLTSCGSVLIEVKDNGYGISKDDVPRMALSSCTSKISNFSDLEILETYGFRGEALSALCAVANVAVITKTKQDEVATLYTLDHSGNIIKSEPCPRETGTTVQVMQLFKEIPVRRQIITNSKKANQDLKTLESLVKSYGMCKFYLRINLKVDNKVLFSKPGTNTLKEAVIYTLGHKVTSNMTWLEVEESEVSMKLMVPLKEVQNVPDIFLSGAQYIFVNNRPIKHKEIEKELTKVIIEGLNHESLSKKKPIFLLQIVTDASNIDVNLEPNKTSILFKDQKTILDMVTRHVKSYYGIKIKEPENGACDESFSYYQDYSCDNKENALTVEWPACKKRKVQIEEKSENVENIEKDHRRSSDNKQDENDKDLDCLINKFHPPDLSESDSNEDPEFALASRNSVKENFKNSDESPPIELSQNSAMMNTLSQLPVVDLGEDFDWNEILHKSDEDSIDKENNVQSSNVLSTSEAEPNRLKKQVTLETWSKGHIPGIKGGTDVKAYDDQDDSSSNVNATQQTDESFHEKNPCKPFVIFSRHIRSQVVKKNPHQTAPEIAQTITNLWKKLSTEERGYYRDLASEAQVEREAKKMEKKEKHLNEVDQNKKRLISMLENMKKLTVKKQENQLLKTTVPWDINIKKISESALNETACKNTDRVIGALSQNLWIVTISSQIWALDALRFKQEYNVSDPTNLEEVKNIDQLFCQWIALKVDTSLLHQIY